MGLTLGEGTLYFGDVHDSDTVVSVKEVIVDEIVVTPFIADRSFTLTMDSKLDRNSWLSLLYGIKITNNWLKIHGGVMTRKLSRRKHAL